MKRSSPPALPRPRPGPFKTVFEQAGRDKSGPYARLGVRRGQVYRALPVNYGRVAIACHAERSEESAFWRGGKRHADSALHSA
jgi:hypothetical protein